MRSFIRHTASMPIKIESSQNGSQTQTLQNVSAGGLCFWSDNFLPRGIAVRIDIPFLENPFIENCTVSWCHKTDEHYKVGVSFDDYQTMVRMRMIEQLCYIEDYRIEILNNENRELTAQDASREWYEKFADRIFKI
jgi:hypothetical protein